MLVGLFWKPYIWQAAGGEWDMMDLTGRMEEQATIQLATSTWLRKRGNEKFLLTL
jgi:hypothetical protein